VGMLTGESEETKSSEHSRIGGFWSSPRDSSFKTAGGKHTTSRRKERSYMLKYDKPVDVREAVQRGVEKGKPPKKIVPVEEDWALREIARIVGSVKPELALVISP